jgi:hypothetical protein
MKSRHTPEQIIGKLREAEARLASDSLTLTSGYEAPYI